MLAVCHTVGFSAAIPVLSVQHALPQMHSLGCDCALDAVGIRTARALLTITVAELAIESACIHV